MKSVIASNTSHQQEENPILTLAHNLDNRPFSALTPAEREVEREKIRIAYLALCHTIITEAGRKTSGNPYDTWFAVQLLQKILRSAAYWRNRFRNLWEG